VLEGALKLIWVTDIHLNFLDADGVEGFFDLVLGARPDAVLVGGDISVAATVGPYLTRLAEWVRRPVYFVLGNHDFWGSGVTEMQGAMRELSQRERWLTWLGGANEPVALSERVGLIGHDGWYDGRCGDYAGSAVKLNDFVRMSDFAYKGKQERLEIMQALSQEAADHFRRLLPVACARFEEVLLLTHVPPFREAAWYEGRVSSDDWLPFMSCQAAGEVLREVMEAHPGQRLTVLCGHTHGGGLLEVLPNLLVKTGPAVYGQPELQEPLVV
jgi:3',5'-cyclic AMP phosphodiesterase CpdA